MTGRMVACWTLASIRAATSPPRWSRPRIGGLSLASVPRPGAALSRRRRPGRPFRRPRPAGPCARPPRGPRRSRPRPEGRPAGGLRRGPALGPPSSPARPTRTGPVNVALATHGETVGEVLGSGDASRPFQTVPLRQAPLTYVSSDGPSGAQSTLELRVNGLLWHEAPRFFGRGPTDRV